MTSPDAADLAIAEANHRIANSFQMVAGLLRNERKLPDLDAEAVLERMDIQLHAFATLHRHLAEVCDRSGLQRLDDYTRDILKLLRDACLDDRGFVLTDRLRFCEVNVDACRCLGLILVELVLNAAKHGEQKPGARILVDLEEAGELGVALRVTNQGAFKTNAVKRRRGLSVIEPLISQIDGVMHVHDLGGVTHVAVLASDQAIR